MVARVARVGGERHRLAPEADPGVEPLAEAPALGKRIQGLDDAPVDARRREVFWRLRLPSALPSLFTALRFATGLGLAAAYFSEGGSVATGVGLGEVCANGWRTSSSTSGGSPGRESSRSQAAIPPARSPLL